MIEILFPRMVPAPVGRMVLFEEPTRPYHKGTTNRLCDLFSVDSVTLPGGTLRANLHCMAKQLGIRISYRKLETGEILVRRVA